MLTVLSSSCLLTTFLLAPVLQHDYSRNYVLGMVRALAEQPGAAVVGTAAPTQVSVSADNAAILRAVGEEYEFDQPGQQMFIFDPLAQLQPIELTRPTLQESGPLPDCGWAVQSSATTLTTVPAGATVAATVLRLGIVTGVESVLHVRLGEREQVLRVNAGLGDAYFVVRGQSGALQAWVESDTAGVCIPDLELGSPWPKS
jgi:hypothetical protein